MSKVHERLRAIACISGLLGAFACTGKGEDRVQAPVQAPAEQPLAKVTVAAPLPTLPPSPAEVPIAEDFELEAETQIHSDNYRKDLAALAREIEQDTGSATSPAAPK